MTAAKSLPTAEELRRSWRESPRWRGVQRGYDAADVVRLRGTIAGRALDRAAHGREAVALSE